MKRRILACSLFSLALVTFSPAQEDKKPAAPATEGTADKPAASAVFVELDTSMGKIVLELDAAKAPLTVANFKKYVEAGYYDGTIFHRVINNFMIQGGGFELKEGKGVQKKTNPPVKNEAKNGLKNLRGTVAMARTNNPHSATSQFFINVKDNGPLDPRTPENPRAASPDGYAVFGKVVEGMDVVDKIKSVPTGRKALTARLPDGSTRDQTMGDVPTEDIVIKTAKIVSAPKK